MKKVILSVIMLCSATIMFADNGKDSLKTTLKSAVVFFNGAELTHTASAVLKAGENSIMLEGLSPVIDVNSLKINVSNSVVVASAEFSTDYLTEKSKSDFVKKLQDSIEIVNAEIAKLTTTININTNSLALLKKGVENNMNGRVENSAGTIKNGISVTELTQNLDFYTTKATALEGAIAADNKKKAELAKTLQRLNNQLNQEQTKNGTYSGILRLSLVSPMAVTANLTITYYTAAASWTPYYDMNIASINKPVVLQSRSKVRQTTGIDWQKIKITLSTAQPSRYKDAPLFNTWFLNYVSARDKVRQFEVNSMQNSYSYEDNKLEEVAYAVKKGKGYAGASQSLASNDANYVEPPKPIYIVDGVPFNGNIYDISPEMIASQVSLSGIDAVKQYGSAAEGGAIVITTKKMEDYIVSEEKNISMEYKIDLPYTIAGNGKEQIIDLKSNELTVRYKYYSAPKLDENVFLIAEFSDWEKLNLLSGMANVTYDGTFVGQTYLNTQSSHKELSVTLGTDKRVSVKREKLTDFSSVKFLGSDTKVTLTYRITVKNNQNKPIHITLKENYPISSQKDIQVELDRKKTTEPSVNKEDLGVITWEADLAVGESRVYEICYSVKYSKDRNINL